MPSPFQILSPDEELRYMREVLEIREPAKLLDRVIEYFNVLQTRSAMLMSLVTLCLTISGFSGHRIAAAGTLPAALLSIGLALSVSSAVLLLMGPLQLRWATRRRCDEGLDATLTALLTLRNVRTRRYHAAAGVLVLGLTAYVGAVILSIFPGATP